MDKYVFLQSLWRLFTLEDLEVRTPIAAILGSNFSSCNTGWLIRISMMMYIIYNLLALSILSLPKKQCSTKSSHEPWDPYKYMSYERIAIYLGSISSPLLNFKTTNRAYLPKPRTTGTNSLAKVFCGGVFVGLLWWELLPPEVFTNHDRLRLKSFARTKENTIWKSPSYAWICWRCLFLAVDDLSHGRSCKLSPLNNSEVKHNFGFALDACKKFQKYYPKWWLDCDLPL